MSEITKMLTLSTCHIKEETKDLLETEAHGNKNPEMPNVYEKGEYGYFIHVPDDFVASEGNESGDNSDRYPGIPDDLYAVMLYAYEKGCCWLCLDRDGPEEDGLEMYDW